VDFTLTAPDLTVIPCDAGNSPTLSNGSAVCTVSAGLLSDPSAYSLGVSYPGSGDGNFSSSSTTFLQTVTPGQTTTTVSGSPNPSVTGEPMTVTALVTPTAPATGTLTGSVKFSGFSKYGTCQGVSNNTVPVSGGEAICTLPVGLPAGPAPLTVTATYGSDPYFAGSTGTYVQKVHVADATIALALTPDTCNNTSYCSTGEGTPITITATVAPVLPSIVEPAGPVVFSIVPAGSVTSLSCQGGNSQMIAAGQATCTLPNGVPAVVYYTLTATLEDPNYAQTSASLYLNSSLSSTNTTIAANGTVGAGAVIPIIATVTDIGSSLIPPTGRVSVSVCSNTTRVCQGSTVPLQSDGTAIYHVEGGEFPGGYTAHARYLGDQNYYASTATIVPFTVIKSVTSIKLVPTENPSEDGSGVTISAAYKGANGSSKSSLIGPPTGTITFTITGPSGTLTCAAGNVVTIKKGSANQGVVNCYLPPGTLTDPNAPSSTPYTVSAAYSGDSDFDPSSATYTQTVVPVEGP
jgi:hypothetical protein